MAHGKRKRKKVRWSRVCQKRKVRLKLKHNKDDEDDTEPG